MEIPVTIYTRYGDRLFIVTDSGFTLVGNSWKVGLALPTTDCSASEIGPDATLVLTLYF